MIVDSLYTALLPVWWALSFIGAAYLFRFARTRPGDGGKRMFFYLLIIVLYAFVSFMPLMVLAVSIPALVIVNFIPFRRGWHFGLATIGLALVIGASMTALLLKFAADREASRPVVAGRFAGDHGEWARRLSEYAKLPLEYKKTETPKQAGDPVVGEEKGFFIPDLDKRLAGFGRTAKATFGGREFAVPVMDGFALRTEEAPEAGVVFLFLSDANGDIMMAVLYGAGGVAEVLGKCREAYADPDAYARDFDMLRSFFPGSEFDSLYLNPAGIAQNSASAVMAAVSVNVTPKDAGGGSYGFGYDVEAFSGALEAGGWGARVFILSALGDFDRNAGLPLLWLNRFLEENKTAAPAGAGA